MSKKDNKKKVQVKDHGHFIGAMALFVGFSVYAMGSFVDSNNDYIRYLTSVLDVGEEVVEETVVDLYEESSFSDVPTNHSSYVAIDSLYSRGVVQGYSDGSFKPDKQVTRAEFSKMLVEAADVDYTTFDASNLAYCFTDVKDVPEHWFATPVCTAKVNGWVGGYPDGSFGAGFDINRAEAAKIVLSAFDFDIPANEEVVDMPYADVFEGDWFVGAAWAAMDNGLVKAAENFNPNQQVTRSDVAAMIYNALEAKGLL